MKFLSADISNSVTLYNINRLLWNVFVISGAYIFLLSREIFYITIMEEASILRGYENPLWLLLSFLINTVVQTTDIKHSFYDSILHKVGERSRLHYMSKTSA